MFVCTWTCVIVLFAGCVQWKVFQHLSVVFLYSVCLCPVGHILNFFASTLEVARQRQC